MQLILLRIAKQFSFSFVSSGLGLFDLLEQADTVGNTEVDHESMAVVGRTAGDPTGDAGPAPAAFVHAMIVQIGAWDLQIRACMHAMIVLSRFQS